MKLDWVGAENTGIPYALGLALRGKSISEIAHETGIAGTLFSEENLRGAFPSVDSPILEALRLALRRKSLQEIASLSGVPALSLYSIRKHDPYAHRSNHGRVRERIPSVRSTVSESPIRKQSDSVHEDVEMDEDMREMARRCYGYGRWDAPYWFIGPEQGQGRHENPHDLGSRLKEWNGEELDDCRDFHDRIGEKRWHRETPDLNRTWRRLMLLLMAFLGSPVDEESLGKYQRDKWGRLDGETCVIELSGLAAKNFQVRRNRKIFRPERIKTIPERMLHYNPELVVMYGAGQKRHWEAITEKRFPPNNILQLGSTIVASTLHPMAHGNRAPDPYWLAFGQELRRLRKT